MECPSCGKINDESFKICEECQTELKEYIFCPNCGEKIEKHSKVCPFCMFIFSIDLKQKRETKNVALPEPKKIKITPPKTLKCPRCEKINDPMNIYCENCRTLLTQNRECPKCGKAHDLGYLYCTECGADLLIKTHHITSATPKFKKTCYVLGLIGSILVTTSFLAALVNALNLISSELFINSFVKSIFGLRYTIGDILKDYSSNIYPIILSLIAFIVGFAGTTRVKDSIESGSIHLIIGAILNMLCIFSPQWYIGTPGILLLIAGILSLFKTNTIESIKIRC